MARGASAAIAAVLGIAAFSGCGGSTSGDDGGTDGSATDARVPADSSADGGLAPDGALCSTDADGDGHRSIACGGDDCDDADPQAYPENAEVCDSAGHDEDCDPRTLGPDADMDGFVSDACCNTQRDGGLLCGTDCADHAATINPSAVESCNLVDDNCDGMIDEGVGPTWSLDADADGFGDRAHSMRACVAPIGYVALGGDCDDAMMSVHPGASEVTDGIDNNCNGVIDEAFEVRGTVDSLGGATTSALWRVLGGSLTLSNSACGTMWCVGGGIDP